MTNNWPAMTIAQASALLTAPGAPFEMETVEVRGRPVRVYKQAHRDLRAIFDAHGSGGSPLNISASPQDGLAQHAPDMAEAPAAVGLRKVREAWAARLPPREQEHSLTPRRAVTRHLTAPPHWVGYPVQA